MERSLIKCIAIGAVLGIMFNCPFTMWIGWGSAIVVSLLTGASVAHVAFAEALVMSLTVWFYLPKLTERWAKVPVRFD